MKVLKFLIIASIIMYTAARVVGPQKDDIKKKTKLQSKQEDDSEGVDVDPVIPVANIEVYEVTTQAPTSVEENSAEQSSASAEISTEVPVVNTDDSNPINRYCKCSSFECDCCRDFSLPLVPIRGPGCANIRYLEGDRLSVGIKFGNRVLANRIVSGRKATPICLPLPGGFTNFCGKIYGISKKNENFRACLGLELRADEDVEAALRVSCFDFGPRGLRVTEAEPIPVTPTEEDEDDDDDDFFGLGGGDDDDDDDDDILGDDADSEDDTPVGQSAGQNPTQSSSDDDDDDDEDFPGLGLLSGDFFDDILGEEDEDSTSADQERPPAPAKKQNNKKKVKITQNTSENEVNGESNEETPISRPAAQNKPNKDQDDDDDDDDEEEDGGFLGLLDELISDGDEDDESAEDQLEDEAAEEIVQNEIEDDVEEIAEEVDDVAATSDPLKDLEANYDEQSLDGTELDDDDIDEDTEDLDDDKPTSYSGLSLLGLRKFFSRFFH